MVPGYCLYGPFPPSLVFMAAVGRARFCRNLRIRAEGTLDHAEVQASDLRGHWVYKGEDEVGSALILRLRQNQAPNPAGAVYNPPSPLQVRGEAG